MAGWTTASGHSVRMPGIALYRHDTLGKWFKVTFRGKTRRVRQTDVGPAPWTGRKIDFTYSAAGLFGLHVSSGGCVPGFPTDTIAKAVLDQ